MGGVEVLFKGHESRKVPVGFAQPFARGFHLVGLHDGLLSLLFGGALLELLVGEGRRAAELGPLLVGFLEAVAAESLIVAAVLVPVPFDGVVTSIISIPSKKSFKLEMFDILEGFKGSGRGAPGMEFQEYSGSTVFSRF